VSDVVDCCELSFLETNKIWCLAMPLETNYCSTSLTCRDSTTWSHLSLIIYLHHRINNQYDALYYNLWLGISSWTTSICTSRTSRTEDGDSNTVLNFVPKPNINNICIFCFHQLQYNIILSLYNCISQISIYCINRYRTVVYLLHLQVHWYMYDNW